MDAMYKIILGAIMLLALTAGAASANRSLSSSEAVVTLLSTELSFSFLEATQVVCEVGVTITLRARAIAKVIGSQIGNATFRSLRCSRNTVRVLSVGNPVFYGGFTGTLPNVTGLDRLKVNGVEFLAEIPFLGNCLVRTNVTGFQEVTAGAVGNLRGERVTPAFRLESTTVRVLSGICPAPGAMELDGTFRPVRGATIGLL